MYNPHAWLQSTLHNPSLKPRGLSMFWHDFCNTYTVMQSLGTEIGIVFALPYH